MILHFDSKNERESYKISHLEYEQAHRGRLFAYQRDTRMLYRPKATGEGPLKWEQVAGPFSPRAFDGRSLREDREYVLSAAKVPASDHHIVIGDLVLDAEYTVEGQVEFRQSDLADHVPMRTTRIQEGPLTLDGQVVLDGELQFEPTREDVNLSMIRSLIPKGKTITIPATYQLHIAGMVQVDGNLIANGELV